MLLSCLGNGWTDHQGNSNLSHPRCPCPPINCTIQAHIRKLCKSQLLHLPNLLLLLLFLLLLILKLLLSKRNSWLSSKFCSQTKKLIRQLIWQLIQ